METILKSSSNGFFDLTLKLSVSDNMEYVNVCVVLLNKANDRKQVRHFDPNKLCDALDFYYQQEHMFIKT